MSVSYPHPVLGNVDDVAGVVVPPTLEYEVVDESLRLSVAGLLTGNPTIDELVNTSRASWFLRLFCSRSFFRETYFLRGLETSITLQAQDLRGRVDVDFRVVATQRIESYAPAGIHSDYGDVKFDVEPGAVLATYPSVSLIIEKGFDPLKAPMTSFVRVREGELQKGPFTVDYHGDNITIALSKQDWKEYQNVKDRLPTLIHSALVLPVLAEAIADIDEYETPWSNRLSLLLEELSLSSDEPLDLAQRLLENPFGRALKTVNFELDRQV